MSSRCSPEKTKISTSIKQDTNQHLCREKSRLTDREPRSAALQGGADGESGVSRCYLYSGRTYDKATEVHSGTCAALRPVHPRLGGLVSV